MYLRIIFLYPLLFLSNYYPLLKRPLHNKLVSPVPFGIVPPPMTFSTITPNLVLFYPALPYHILLQVVPTLTVMMKPINYSCAHFIMILLILLRMVPMSFLLKLITHFQNTLFLVGTPWSGNPVKLLENLSSSSGLPGAHVTDLCMIYLNLKVPSLNAIKDFVNRMLNLLKLSDLLPGLYADPNYCQSHMFW